MTGSDSDRFYKQFGFQATGKQIEDLPVKRRGDKPIPEIEMVLKRLNKY